MDSSSKCTPSSKGGQSNQKWEEMFECLVGYVKEQKQKETEGMSDEEIEKWEWSGNVPTMYKTKDGKALGRWINNQRSAKSKGSLKPEREERLISTGLKWSVLTTNAWTDMLEELKVYVKEKTRDGQPWDGNVPTNYKIKSNGKNEIAEGDDDKNLGRWINRQRSLYQAGKLKDDRRKQLEEVGLKWAVLSTTSWQTMYDALCQYASSKRETDKNGHWDGNVPASFETDDKPPKKLGRWVNRQRSAYANKKLKKEFVDKLEKAGLKWTANDSKKDMEQDDSYRQRLIAQSQRGVIHSVAQSARTGTGVIHSNAGPIVAGKAPTPGQVMTSNATIPSANYQKSHPSIVSKAGIPGIQTVSLSNRSAGNGTVTIPRPMQSKVIIPSRSASNSSASKVIIPARSLIESGSNVSKVVIPARSAAAAASMRHTKVVIPARSLAQSAGAVSKVNSSARVPLSISDKTKRVIIPAGSSVSNKEITHKLPQMQSNSNLTSPKPALLKNPTKQFSEKTCGSTIATDNNHARSSTTSNATKSDERMGPSSLGKGIAKHIHTSSKLTDRRENPDGSLNSHKISTSSRPSSKEIGKSDLLDNDKSCSTNTQSVFKQQTRNCSTSTNLSFMKTDTASDTKTCKPTPLPEVVPRSPPSIRPANSESTSSNSAVFSSIKNDSSLLTPGAIIKDSVTTTSVQSVAPSTMNSLGNTTVHSPVKINESISSSEPSAL